MDRRRNRASTRRNHGAASVEGKGGRLRCGAAAAVAGAAGAASGAATASDAAVSVSTISAVGLDHGQGRARSSGQGEVVQAFSGVTICDKAGTSKHVEGKQVHTSLQRAD